jgi:hypothetical protein
LAHALDASTGELPADPPEVKSDGAVSRDADKCHRLNQVSDDIGIAADRGNRLQERADRVAFRIRLRFLLTDADDGALAGSARPSAQDEAEAVLERFPVGVLELPTLAEHEPLLNGGQDGLGH